MKNKKVIVGMSGGVDSSVAAYILKEQGYDVEGVTMHIWQKEDREMVERAAGCCSLGDIEDARRVANTIGIEHHVLNFRDDFKKLVIDNFINEYKNGRTPNPCIACNRYVKWQSLLHRALPLGADYISTGHYAKIVKNESNGRYTIVMQANNPKDQSYALFNLTQKQLKHTFFPLGDYTKEKVREIAKNINLTVAKKPDSQEICFIPDNNYGNFLQQNLNEEIKEGNFLDINGNVLGLHKGIIYYTIGQRKNLGIAFGVPMYVKEINASTGDIVLTQDVDLLSRGLICNDLNFMYLSEINRPTNVLAKIRYSHTPTPAIIFVENGELTCHFETKQRAITPGQAAVFYDDKGYLLCGGTIVKAL